MKWIKISDELPPHRKEVLCLLPRGRIMVGSLNKYVENLWNEHTGKKRLVKGKQFFSISPYGDLELNEVSYWMDFPELPK
jgi:hypothetical protein